MHRNYEHCRDEQDLQIYLMKLKKMHNVQYGRMTSNKLYIIYYFRYLLYQSGKLV